MGPRRYFTSGCGIVGTVGCAIADEVMERMTDALTHRGPDGRGLWSTSDRSVRLGHRRLAIIGIDERGTQPMTRGSATITCNGEIYNYPELRKTLEKLGYVFSSDCDTEVILHAYAEWGMDCLRKLNGIFAFGLYDARTRKLFTARDHLGVKPLVYCDVGGGFAFASEARALLACPLVARGPDFEAIRSDVLHGLLGQKHRTWFSGISHLEPGHFIEIDCDTGARTLREYWRIPDGPTDLVDERQVIESLRETLRDAVRLQVLSDVGVSACLSGGIDSSAVSLLASEGRPPGLDVFTLEYEENRPQFGADALSNDQVDLVHARSLASAHAMRMHVVPLSSRRLLDRDHLDSVIRGSDVSIFLDMRVLSLAVLYDYVRQTGQKVLLTGQGADEVWLGYFDDPIYTFWKNSADQLSTEYLVREFFGRRIPMGLGAWNEKFISRELAHDSARSNLETNYQHYHTDDPLQRLSYLVTRTHLQSILAIDDKIAMMNGIETRVPWLDHRLVEIAFRVPGFLKVSSPNPETRPKWLVQQAMRGIVPSGVIDRKKSPFPETPPVYMEIIKRMVVDEAARIRRSPFTRELFSDLFLSQLGPSSPLRPRDWFTIYSLWRFGEIHRL